ncbi:MAG TPA: acylase [Acidobacteriota bacterium]|nr:acylase [Acidobacteriota bacterium]
MKRLSILLICLSSLFAATCAPRQQPASAEILWDSYGIPHVFAETNRGMFRAFGWAQMHSHGDLILRLYGESRGRAAEYWGESHLDHDRWIWTNGVPQRSQQWLSQIDPEFAGLLEGFVEGMNAYSQQHSERLDDQREVVLPLRVEDVLNHMQRTLHFTFLASPRTIQGSARRWQEGGSNGWVVGPSRTANRHPLLLANPHLPWSDFFLFYEAHLVSPANNTYGVTLVGLPVLGIAFNDTLGWTHTVNTIDAADVYELTLSEDGYLFDGEVRPFQQRSHTLKVRRQDGTVEEEELTVKESVHGPVVAEKEGKALALRVAGLDRAGVTRAWWDLGRTRSMQEFQNVLKRMELPLFTVLYADREGNIMHFFGGTTPRRKEGYNWGGIVPGDTSETLWTSIHDFLDMPIVVNPLSDWLQNANDPPWNTTVDSPLYPAAYPDYLAPQFMHFRAQQSFQLLQEGGQLTMDDMIRLKHSTEMEAAVRIRDELVEAARKNGGETARRAAEVLENWDLNADSESRGGVLFEAFFREAGGPRLYAQPWKPEDPLSTPSGLADPKGAVTALVKAAERVESQHGSMDVAWGEVYRLQRDGIDLPANGGPGALGIFRVIGYDDDNGDGRPEALVGDSYVAVVEFSDPVKAQAVLSYGNASQSGSPHRTDQLQLVSRQTMRPVWLTREEIEANLERKETLP